MNDRWLDSLLTLGKLLVYVGGGCFTAIKLFNAWTRSKVEIEEKKARENSVGMTAIEELKRADSKIKSDLENMEKKIDEMQDDFRYYKDELRGIVETMRRHWEESIRDSLQYIKNMNKKQ